MLNLTPTSEFIAIESQESSLDEWQKEAQRLEMQGKQAQADAIRNTLLHAQQVPWPTITLEYLAQLQNRALHNEKKDKEARLLLFEYAMYYHQPKLFTELAKIGFAPALKVKKDYSLLERKYFIGYTSKNTIPVMRQVALYGINFRNIFNQTPLMIASSFGNNTLVKQLIEKGVDPSLTDNLGRNAFQIALQKALLDKRFAQEKLALLYECLSPDNISLRVENKLIKLDVHRMEFFLVNAMIAMAHHKQQFSHRTWAFKTDDFLEPLVDFPEKIIAERYKKRAYLSSILAKNEINRQDIYNKKLFLRVKHGHYILNPGLMLKLEDGWVNIYKLLDLEPIKIATVPSNEMVIV